jgi:catechol 2,3-dioxygenase-like lactoylglutathione lyase family enzyme/uncharacterized cupredoxin-like copper-binding protein
MRPHLSLDVRNVPASVAFYEKVFGVAPQKQTQDYAKFDLTEPALNFSLVSSTGRLSSVDHLGIEVESVEEISTWKVRLQAQGVLERVEENTACCFARQDKLWFSDPDGNAWEVFTVHEQLPVEGILSNTGCCIPNKAAKAPPSCATFKAGSTALPSLALLVAMLLSFVGGWPNIVGADGETSYTATDYGFTGPDRILAGSRVIQITNNGKELHHMQVVQLPDDKTAADIQGAMETHPEHLPTWIKHVGGPNAILPGTHASSTMQLTAGRYALLCLIPDKHGVLHGARGMVKALTVIPAQHPHDGPRSTAIIRQRDFGFMLSHPLKPGRHTIEVHNDGTQPHEVVLVKLKPGATAKDVATALEPGASGPPPGQPIGRIVGIEPRLLYQ